MHFWLSRHRFVTAAVRCAKKLASLPHEANAKCRGVTVALRSRSELVSLLKGTQN